MTIKYPKRKGRRKKVSREKRRTVPHVSHYVMMMRGKKLRHCGGIERHCDDDDQ